MKDIFFTADLLALFRHDQYFSDAKNLSITLRKFGLSSSEHVDNKERMFHALVVHIMDQYGESEPFLAGAFIGPDAIVKRLKEHGLPAPAALLPAQSRKNNSKKSIDAAQFEKYFDIVCRNCGTVTDPLANAYRTPIGRLIFRTFLETRLTLGINTTAKYVLEHISDFDAGKIVTSIHEDYVTWKTEDSKEKLTSIETIAKFILNFNRELKTLL